MISRKITEIHFQVDICDSCDLWIEEVEKRKGRRELAALFI